MVTIGNKYFNNGLASGSLEVRIDREMAQRLSKQGILTPQPETPSPPVGG
jgi:hypothetical protein